MKSFNILPVSRKIQTILQETIDTKTKPVGSLGRLEDVALQIGLIQQTCRPELNNPHIVVFAGDHGIAAEGVSAYPAEVTQQMVMNFLNGGAAINVFCRQHQINIKVVDAGVNFDFAAQPELIAAKIAPGTRNFLKSAAMTEQQCVQALQRGAQIINDIHERGCNVIGFGEMGIGNTAAASILMHIFCEVPLDQCVGRGTGLNDQQLQHKMDILQRAVERHRMSKSQPLSVLAAFGGFEIVMMCGAILQAAENRMLVLVDGFIATVAYLAALQFSNGIKDYSLFCHQSDEKGHSRLLQALKAKPLLNLNLRLGEGTGAAVAFPIVQSAVLFLNDMASFTSAGVSEQEPC